MQEQDSMALDVLRRRISELEETLSRQSRIQDALRGTRFSSGVPFFDLLSLELAQATGADIAFVGALSGDQKSVRTLGLCADGKTAPAFEYALAGTPCADVVGKDVCSFPMGITSLYPKDILLQEMKIEGYCGVPLFDTRKRAIGLIVLLTRRPFAATERAEALLRTSAARASAELERSQAEAKLRNIFDSNMVGIVFWNSQGEGTEVNDAFLRTTGYTREDLESLRIPWGQ